MTGEVPTSSGISPVAQAWNWKDRVALELRTAKAWDGNWGYLRGAQSERTAPASTSTADAPANFFAIVQRDSARRKRRVGGSSVDSGAQAAGTVVPSGNDSLDQFIKLTLSKSASNRPLPREELRRPMLASHSYGWGRSLERFGNLTLLMR